MLTGTGTFVVVLRHRPDLFVGFGLHPLFQIATQFIQHLGVAEAELPVAHTAAIHLRKPFGMRVEIGFHRNQILESVDKQAPLAVEVVAGVQFVPFRIAVVDVGNEMQRFPIAESGILNVVKAQRHRVGKCIIMNAVGAGIGASEMIF